MIYGSERHRETLSLAGLVDPMRICVSWCKHPVAAKLIRSRLKLYSAVLDIRTLGT